MLIKYISGTFSQCMICLQEFLIHLTQCHGELTVALDMQYAYKLDQSINIKSLPCVSLSISLLNCSRMELFQLYSCTKTVLCLVRVRNLLLIVFGEIVSQESVTDSKTIEIPVIYYTIYNYVYVHM